MTRKTIIGAAGVMLACLLTTGTLLRFWPPAHRYVRETEWYRSLYRWSRYGRMVMLTVVARDTNCTVGQAVRGGFSVRRQSALRDGLLKSSRLIDQDATGGRLWETPSGRFWIPRNFSGYALCHLLAEQKRRVYGPGVLGVRTGDVVLDCGAHVGVYSKEALAAGARLVVAIEPAPENLLCLRRNLASEIARGRVIVCPKGVWDKEDILTLNVRESLDDSFVLGGSQTAAKVPVTTIDTLVARLGLERVDFIKMDIEGSEQRALMGAQKTIAKYRPRMALAVYHLPDDRERIPALVRAAWPGSQVACGPCSERNRRIVPDIMYFH